MATDKRSGAEWDKYMGQEQTTQFPDITGKKQGKWFPPEEYRWEKGQSGNPAGRPPGSVSITAEIKKKLLEIPENQQKSYLDLLINRILKKAVVDGNDQMIKQIWSYIDGPPRQAENFDTVMQDEHINLLNKNGVEVQGECGEKILV